MIFKNCTAFTDWRGKINNRQVDNAKDIDVLMPMYNLIQYSDIYLKKSESLWQYDRDTMVVLLIFLLIIVIFYLNLKKITG